MHRLPVSWSTTVEMRSTCAGPVGCEGSAVPAAAGRRASEEQGVVRCGACRACNARAVEQKRAGRINVASEPGSQARELVLTTCSSRSNEGDGDEQRCKTERAVRSCIDAAAVWATKGTPAPPAPAKRQAQASGANPAQPGLPAWVSQAFLHHRLERQG